MSATPPRIEDQPATDPALSPERNEEDALLRPEESTEFAFHWDLGGRVRKIRDLFLAPSRLFATLADAPDIFTPLLFLSLLGLAYLGFFSLEMQRILAPDMAEVLASIPESQLTGEQREGFPEMVSGLIIWSVGAIGLNHLVLAGVYSFCFLWLCRYLGFKPVGYPQLLSVMAFVWLPRPLYQLAVDGVLLSSRHYDSWLELKQRSAELYPGMHLLLPEQLPFDQFWGLATFYLLGPLDIFLVIALAWLYVAAPHILMRPEPRTRLLVVTALLFILVSAFATRGKFPPEKLQQLGPAAAGQALLQPSGISAPSP